jgi:hypothetical protein
MFFLWQLSQEPITWLDKLANTLAWHEEPISVLAVACVMYTLVQIHFICDLLQCNVVNACVF